MSLSGFSRKTRSSCSSSLTAVKDNSKYSSSAVYCSSVNSMGTDVSFGGC